MQLDLDGVEKELERPTGSPPSIDFESSPTKLQRAKIPGFYVKKIRFIRRKFKIFVPTVSDTGTFSKQNNQTRIELVSLLHSMTCNWPCKLFAGPDQEDF